MECSEKAHKIELIETEETFKHTPTSNLKESWGGYCAKKVDSYEKGNWKFGCWEFSTNIGNKYQLNTAKNWSGNFETNLRNVHRT